ncbi:hypothetical protein O0I10_000733 [Lichtheimia ornata]|uniref:Bacteriophage T5 Orf172 DNA-binding domain-containing protein n=1 Tax=Lichtheimia ornata TaxID=688661 RepID=A0AAD7Y480_9FUNG|nr:uncharacterized protein O0I10_000733 [Lichtheimia ornata]KAJ8663491.1 hypothetical protein O0I10_000733 [Lichtheimia ornata]
MLTGHKWFQTLPWYALALQAVVPPPFHHRSFSTTISVLRSNVVKQSNLVSRQCRGVRVYDGQRCTRTVKADVICTDESQLYCHSHQPKAETKLALPTTTTTTTTAAVPASASSTSSLPILTPCKPLYDGWELWINDKLSRKKRKEIRQEMRKPLSQRDQDGYIYAYILTHGPRVPTSKYAYFKIGRTIDPIRRMYQVSQKCKYVPEIVELFPHMPSASQLKKRLTTANAIHHPATIPKCPVSHRVERLVHLELSGLYPHAGFNCKECGTKHREWFRIARQRKPGGSYATDHELWMEHIRPVILRWIQYGIAVTAIQS